MIESVFLFSILSYNIFLLNYEKKRNSYVAMFPTQWAAVKTYSSLIKDPPQRNLFPF